MFVTRTFTKCACVVLVHRCANSIKCKITLKQLASNTQTSIKTCEYGAQECQAEIKLYHKSKHM